jgi:hypothetical protein
LCLKASTPFSLARFIHWLTAPSVTPRASAICFCFQPRSFSSKARKRLPSRQSLAWLDNVFSIAEFIIPTSLSFYAEISRTDSEDRLSLGQSMLPEEVAVVFLGGLHEALPGCPRCAEGGREGAVLATQVENVRVRLIQVVVELRKKLGLVLLYASVG